MEQASALADQTSLYDMVAAAAEAAKGDFERWLEKLDDLRVLSQIDGTEEELNQAIQQFVRTIMTSR